MTQDSSENNRTNFSTNVTSRHTLPSRDSNGAVSAHWHSYFLASP